MRFMRNTLNDFAKWLWLHIGVLAYQAAFLLLCLLVAIPAIIWTILRKLRGADEPT
jgi:hypothetical protein